MVCDCLSLLPLSCPHPHTVFYPDLRQILRRIALIRSHHLPIDKLLVRISWVNNNLPIRNRQGLKPIPISKLSAPAATDRINPTLHIVVASAGSRIACRGVGARGRSANVGVDGVGVFAGGVGCVAGADEGLDGPLWSCGGDHGLVGCGGGGSKSGQGRKGSEEQGLEMHGVDVCELMGLC